MHSLAEFSVERIESNSGRKPMKLLRIAAAAFSLIALGLGGAVNAQSYPEEPLSLIVPFSAGGPTDAVGRLLAQQFKQHLGQPVVVKNIDGAGSTIGTTNVAQAEPDGYTLLLATSTAMVISPHIYKTLGYDGYRSFDAIGLVTEAPFLILVRENSNYQTLDELLQYGRDNPGTLNYATPGVGTVQHLSLERIVAAGKIDAVHIPFKGTSGSRTAFLGDQVDFTLETPNSAAPLIEAGEARALAVLSKDRIAAFSDVPTTVELGMDVTAQAWFSLMAPAGTPGDRLEILREVLAQALQDEGLITSMKGAGFTPTPMSTIDFENRLETQFELFKSLVESAGIAKR